MDKQIARDLLYLVNDPDTMEVLLKYINSRIEAHRNTLEQIDSPEDRGALKELRLFFTLREAAIKESR